MYNADQHKFCSAFYTVEKTIEVVVKIRGEDSRIRIDALKDGRTEKYCTKAYFEEHVTLQPTYPQTKGSFDKKPEDFRIWVDFVLRWTDRDSAEGALR